MGNTHGIWVDHVVHSAAMRAHPVNRTRSAFHLSTAGLHGTYGPEEIVIPWNEISDVVACAVLVPPSGVLRFLSFGTVYGGATELNDQDDGWATIIAQLPTYLPCV